MSDDVSTGFVMDRELQRELLLRMRDVYPNPLIDFQEEWVQNERLIGNLVYLEGHGLCESGLSSGIGGHWSWSGATITVAGLDFVADDGGLSAILNVVTVKLHADTIRDVLAAKIDASDLPPEKKSAWKRAIGSLSSITLQAASKELITAGIDHVPGGMSWIEHLIGLVV